MAQTPLTPIVPKGPYGTISAGQLDLVWTAADVSNGNSFPLTGREILLVQNSGASAYTFTITSAPDAEGRSGDVTTYSVAAGVVSCYSFRGAQSGGWQQSDGTVHLAASNAAIKFAVLQPST
jgi:hypothetical protein